MKKLLLITNLMFITLLIHAQSYQISFSGTGESFNVENVRVKNLTQGTTIDIDGTDILHLVGTLEINQETSFIENLSIYPNPLLETSTFEFYSNTPKSINIEIFNIEGKLIVNKSDIAHTGFNAYEISGFPQGSYSLTITTSTSKKSLNFVSLSNSDMSPTLNLISIHTKRNKEIVKNEKNLIQMQYNDGDILFIEGISGNYSTVLTTIPEQTQTINFDFIPCSDLDGNNYSVVTIGEQIWMAENLKYLPNVVGPNTSSSSEPYYYVSNYNGTDINEAKETNEYNMYGVLYNWPAAMSDSEANPANPSDAQGICPTGWHLPTISEWVHLADYLGGQETAGIKLKESGESIWDPESTNESGFSALPGGQFTGSSFYELGWSGTWWSTTNTTNPHYFNLVTNSDGYDKYYEESYHGNSVRCIKN